MPHPSKVIYGTMRMLNIKRSIRKWIYLFDQLYDNGINNFHLSREYKSYKLFVEVLTKSKLFKKNINILAKCYTPNFEEFNYSHSNLEKLVNSYARELKVTNLSVQWMWRGNLDNDSKRCKRFHENSSLIKSSFNFLKKKNVKKIFCFPYSTKFAEEIKKNFFVDGLTVYFNPKEQEYNSYLKKYTIGIRPLRSGKILKNNSFKDAMDFTFKNKEIYKSIISINRKRHFKEMFNYFNV